MIDDDVREIEIGWRYINDNLRMLRDENLERRAQRLPKFYSLCTCPVSVKMPITISPMHKS